VLPRSLADESAMIKVAEIIVGLEDRARAC
jgi:hypothetical protein